LVVAVVVQAKHRVVRRQATAATVVQASSLSDTPTRSI